MITIFRWVIFKGKYMYVYVYMYIYIIFFYIYIYIYIFFFFFFFFFYIFYSFINFSAEPSEGCWEGEGCTGRSERRGPAVPDSGERYQSDEEQAVPEIHVRDAPVYTQVVSMVVYIYTYQKYVVERSSEIKTRSIRLLIIHSQKLVLLWEIVSYTVIRNTVK